MEFRACRVVADGQNFDLRPNRPNSFEPFFADFRIEKNDADGSERVALMLHPKGDIFVQSVEIQWNRDSEKSESMFCNGFLSSSESRVLPLGARLKNPFFRSRKWATTGDEKIKIVERGAGWLHSWSFTFFKKWGHSAVDFVGSLDENSGFTLFQHDLESRIFFAKRDLGDGLALAHSMPIFDLVFFKKASETAAFEAFFEKMDGPRPNVSPIAGLAVDSKNGLEKGLADGKMGDFLIENWAAATSDWLDPNREKWPDGLAFPIQKIGENGGRAGLALAPFLVSGGSKIFRDRKDWLLADAKTGRPVALEGGFFALDFSKKEARDWLSGVFHVFLEKWRVDFFRLEGLAAACLATKKGQIRGQAMREAMEFLRSLAAGRPIIAADVPMASAFGLADFLETAPAPDFSNWKNWKKGVFDGRELAETRAFLRSAISRAGVGERAFLAASRPVFFDPKNVRLTKMQLDNLLIINALCSKTWFSNVELSGWPERIFGARVESVRELEEDFFELSFSKNDARGLVFSNLSPTKKNGPPGGSPIVLKPFEARVFWFELS